MNRWVGWVALLAATGCVVDEGVGSIGQPIRAYCEANVEGVGMVPVETEYLARVVNCENGGAAFEALKVQAITARSYLYYKLDTSGSIADGTSDQVYGCDRDPGEQHYRAVEETAGLVLRYMDTQVAAFYVAGSHQEGPSCMGGSDDPTNTERYVTYNEGRAGEDLTQTTLGWVNAGNYANRGCASQNGAHCLAGQGWPYEDIIRFYYGEDIELVRAEGACVTPPDEPDAGPAMGDASVVGVDASVGGDASMLPPREGDGLEGGCSASGRGSLGWLAIGLLAFARRRR